MGGSVAEKIPELIEDLKSTEKNFLLIPGGWKFADLVREVDEKYRLKEITSHWMAIACMDVYAYFVSNFGVNVVIPKNIDELRNIKGVNVVLPHFILKNDSEFLKIPASWGVTSDSISVWFAMRLGRERVIKVTDVDGVFINGELVTEISAEELVKLNIRTCVDEFTPKMLKNYGISMFVCSTKEVKNYILKGKAKGTLIRGK